MTIRELSQLHWLKQEIADLQERLVQMEARAYRLSLEAKDGAQSTGGSGDGMGLVAAMLDTRAALEKAKIEAEREQLRLLDYIQTVPDVWVRRLMRLRFADGLTWTAVAMRAGGSNTADGVRKAVFRYIDGQSGAKGPRTGEKESAPST